ncbi:SMP-30/gluconolactonase/LRE family protein [Saccharopolyspora pogona]|uniref:SMP-30/gluconolactonase/LRE family protein n=1 Tax=Saccharopolyspora pogona TaxID=333966 RepID=UPI0016861833|nr:SMP-30/gluconolactonase/LRE family protein [Saccharopolyspora pogona]
MELFAQGLFAPECPVILDNGDVLVVEMRRDRSAVTRVDAETRELHAITLTGGFPNGLLRDAQGKLWVGEAHEHALICYDAEGIEEVRITKCGDEPFRWPNDHVIGHDGAIYMTDSGAWEHEVLDPVKMTLKPGWCDYPFDGRVYRIDRATLDVTRIDNGIRFANGIAFDRHDRLYVAETIGGNIYRYDVFGTNPRRELFGNVWDGVAPDGFIGPDGMKFGADGRLYCTVMGAGHIVVFDEAGTVVERIETKGKAPTNIAFTEDGRHKMFVTEIANGAIEMHDVPCDGLPIYRDSVVIPAQRDVSPSRHRAATSSA